MVGTEPFIAVYITASGRNGTLYTGVTSDLRLRVRQHKNGIFEGFSREHGCTRLVWFEMFPDMASAIRQEKLVKRWRRIWKLRAIEAENPEWRDLSDGWYDETTNLWLLDPANP